MGNNSVVKAFSWKLAERVVIQGGGFVVQVILARILLPKDFASLAIIVAITNYANILVQGGLSTALIQKDELDDLDVSTMLVCSLGVALILYSAIFIISPMLSRYYNIPELKWAIRYLGIILFFHAINSVQIALLQRKMAFKKLFFRSLIALPIASVVSIVMALAGLGIWALVSYNVINIVLLVLIMSFSQEFHYSIRFSIDRAKKIYSFSGKIMVASLVSGVYETMRTMIIGKQYDANDLAYYDKAYTYSGYAVQTVGYSISAVMLPVLSREQGDIKKLKESARRAIQLSVFFMFPILIGLSAASKTFISCLLTEKWLSCAPFFSLFCILRAPECLITIDKQAYYALGKSDICLKYEMGLCLANFISLFITIKKGVLFVAIGAVIVELIAGCVIAVISSVIYTYSVKERLCDILTPVLSALLIYCILFYENSFTFNKWVVLGIQIISGVIIHIIVSDVVKDRSYAYCKELILSLLKKRINRNK